MSLLVSDFDGTLDGFNQSKNKVLNLDANVKAIKRFVEQGNYFIIASSASTDFLKNKANNSNLLYHYLIGGNGILGNDKLNHQYKYDSKIGYKKEDGIYRIIDWLALKYDIDIPDEDIFTIGDEKSDYEMIKLWNGFQIGNNSILKEVSLGEYDDVYKLVEDIENNKVKRKTL